jgi:phosphatidylserine decarboxylase
VATIMVGAIGVGRISVSFDPSVLTNVGRAPCTHRYASPPKLDKGGELGRFHLGSTAIVLTGPTPSVELSVLAGQRVRVGSAIGKVREDASEQIDAR